MAPIEFRNVSKRYPDGFEAVTDLDLTVRDGEFLVLVGPSGCGKSTALRMVAGLEDISGGELMIDGRVVNALAPRDRDVAMVFQSYALYPHLTVRQNIGFGLRVRGVSRAERARAVEEAAALLELTPHLDPGAHADDAARLSFDSDMADDLSRRRGELLAVLDPEAPVRPGAAVRLRMREGKVHLFDAGSGAAV